MALLCSNKTPNGATLPGEFSNILDLGYFGAPYFGPQGAVESEDQTLKPLVTGPTPYPLYYSVITLQVM